MSAPVPVAAAAPERLRLTEIFLSLQGESNSVGWPTVFVRLTGCPLRCGYCDTTYSFHGGQWWDIDAIVAEVARLGVRHAEREDLTGRQTRATAADGDARCGMTAQGLPRVVLGQCFHAASG